MTPEALNEAVEAAREAIVGLADQLAQGYARALRAAGRHMAATYRDKAVSLAADASQIPPDGDEVLDPSLADQMRERGAPARKKAAKAIGTQLNQAGVAFDVGGVFDDDLLAAVGDLTVLAAEDDLRATYVSVIEQAADQGWSVDETADQIRQAVGDAADGHAATYARTELNGLANGGSTQAAQAVLGDDALKVWLATDDAVTRDSHVEADGQAVPIKDFFTVGGAPLRYPGDPFGPGEEVYNCRCTVIYQAAVTAAGGGRHVTGLPLLDSTEEEPVRSRATTASGADPQPAALTANGDGDADVDVDLQQRDPVPFSATLCVEGQPTEDGRMLERGSVSWRELPLTLMGMTENPEFGGHAGAEVSGRIDTIDRQGDEIVAVGELTTEFGVDKLAPMIDDRTVRGVSIDLAVMDYEIRDPDSGEKLDPEEELDYWLEGKPVLFVVLEGIILGATVCPMPAIANAEIAITAAALDPHGMRLTVFTPFDRQPVTAAASTTQWEAPPRARFEATEFPGPTPLTITDDGRVFGHLATWDTCHTGIAGVCTTAPRSKTGYAYFHVGEIETAEGDRVAIGKLMVGTKHASLSASRAQASRHYDDNGHVAAYVRAHDGEHGIWLSGVVAPCTDAQLVEFRANPPSGDWRSVNGALELVAACAVPVPGFPVPRAEANLVAAADQIEVSALIASSGLIVPEQPVRAALVAAGCGCEDSLPVEGVDELADLSAAD